jgi:hypothetical protein
MKFTHHKKIASNRVITKELRKKNTSVEPPDLSDLDYKTKIQIGQHLKKKYNQKSQVFDDVVMPVYDIVLAKS